MGLLKDAKAHVAERKAIDETRPHSGLQYRVDQVRETIVGDKITTNALQDLLNQRASEGWAFRQGVEASVKGRVGPGGADGLLLIFERPVA